MDINDLFDGIMKSINQFADEIAKQRLQEKMQDTGRGPENGGVTIRRISRRKRSGVRRICAPLTRCHPCGTRLRLALRLLAGFANRSPETGVIGVVAPTRRKQRESLTIHRKRKPVAQPDSVCGRVCLLFGGGGGSRTRVRKCSPPVSTCLVPYFNFRAGNSVGT